MTPDFSNDLLGRLSGWATAEFGLRFPPDRWSELGRGVASAALELGIPDLAGWAEGLASGTAPVDHLRAVANHLTISETYFFRQRETFQALENEILPARLAFRRRQAAKLRLWSAGCASGEEPYSLAILLRERFPDVEPDRVVIAGTDVNSRVLGRATRGVYSEWSFRETPDWVRAGYFNRKSGGRYELVPETRRRVHFVQLNLAAPIYPAEFGERADFDVILCRNVLMYFSAEWQERILRRLVQALTPEGWLLVGPCDFAAAQPGELGLQFRSPGVFQKVDAGTPRRDSVPPFLPLTTPPPPVWAMPLLAVEAPVVAPFAPAAAPDAVPAVPEPVVVPAATEGDVASVRAQLHANRGELDEALAACEQAIATDKTNPGFYYLRACILQEQNRLDEAADAFRRVLYLEPHAVMAQFALGCLADRQGRRGDARHHLSIVLRMLSRRTRGDTVPGSEGLTVGRLRAVIEHNLSGDAA
jgi:chemotaxis protein methyltransferase CheR